MAEARGGAQGPEPGGDAPAFVGARQGGAGGPQHFDSPAQDDEERNRRITRFDQDVAARRRPPTAVRRNPVDLRRSLSGEAQIILLIRISPLRETSGETFSIRAG